jgi:nicotinamide-nucleotide amidase
MVRLRLSTTGFDKALLEEELEEKFILLQSLVKEYIVTNEDEPIELVVGKLLKKKNKTISTAESCTGGYISHLLTSHAGSSAYFNSGIVSYSYKAKEDLLDVDEETLLKEGAVSEAVVMAMAKGGLKKMKTDYIIAVSGIMGPGGGMTDKPVGTVWMATGNKDKIITQKFFSGSTGKEIFALTAVNALNMLRKFIEVNG